MEEILVVIFQVLFELTLQVLAELPWDVFVGTREMASSPEPGPGTWVALSLIMGAAVGGVSLLVFPNTLIRWSGARMVNLIVAPTVSGFLAASFPRSRTRQQAENRPDPRLRGVYAACFTLTLALIRFTYAVRPGR